MRLDRTAIAPLEVMQRYLDAAMRGDWDTGFGFFADDIALHIPGRSEFAGEHRGKRGGDRLHPHGSGALARAPRWSSS